MATSGLLGMDVERGEKNARQMRTDAASIHGIVKRLNPEFSDTSWWLGDDANRFRANWAESYSRHLTAIATALEEAATALERQAATQREASSGH